MSGEDGVPAIGNGLNDGQQQIPVPVEHGHDPLLRGKYNFPNFNTEMLSLTCSVSVSN